MQLQKGKLFFFCMNPMQEDVPEPMRRSLEWKKLIGRKLLLCKRQSTRLSLSDVIAALE